MPIIKEAIKHLFSHPVTLKYPYERTAPPAGFRGRPVWNTQRCFGCGLCSRICPSGAIEMTGKGKGAEITHYVDRCMFCGQCAESCPRNAIEMTEEFELAGFNRKNMIHRYKIS